MKPNLRLWGIIVWVIVLALYSYFLIQQTYFIPYDQSNHVILRLTPIIGGAFGVTGGILLNLYLKRDKTKPTPS